MSAVSDSATTTIVLDADIDLSSVGVLNVDNRVIDLGGNKISASNFSLIFQGKNFTLKNGTFDAKGGSYALFIGDEGDTDNVVVDGITARGGVNVYNATNVLLKNVHIQGTSYYGIWCDEGGHVTVESGVVGSTNGPAVLGLTDDDSALTINGGTFNTGNGARPLVLGGSDYADPVVKGGTFDCSALEYVDSDIKFELLKDNVYTYYGTFGEALEAAGSDGVIIPAGLPESSDMLKATFIFNDGTSKQIVVYADAENKVKVIDAKRAGYIFDGWSSEGTSTVYKAGDSITLTDNVEFTAQYRKITSTHTAAKKPTCTKTGNIEYWYSPELDAYFKDAALTKEIDYEDTIIPALGHHYKDGKCTRCGAKDPDYSATTDDSTSGDSDSLPETGDSSAFMFALAAAFVCSGVTLVVANRKKPQMNEVESN